MSQLKALVAYESRFGNTEKVARALESGLREAGLSTTVERVGTLTAEGLNQFDIICAGGPTEQFGPTGSIKEFMAKMKGCDLAGKWAFAFDTKLDSRLSGSAAKYIEHSFDDLGLRIALSRESGIVKTVRHGGKIEGAELRAGEEDRFRDIGRKLGALVSQGVIALPA